MECCKTEKEEKHTSSWANYFLYFKLLIIYFYFETQTVCHIWVNSTLMFQMPKFWFWLPVKEFRKCSRKEWCSNESVHLTQLMDVLRQHVLNIMHPTLDPFHTEWKNVFTAALPEGINVNATRSVTVHKIHRSVYTSGFSIVFFNSFILIKWFSIVRDSFCHLHLKFAHLLNQRRWFLWGFQLFFASVF